ncbi:extracellular solute-binding protein [Vibrio penaeicida]|uniref:extracellular solute-binding protein n=1 Tax=Vibrio penaeicida TaxID=104609 RepID=UPI000CEA66FB|nr:extracellular solute-binding protein [Vibrio penaeicida]
MEKTHLMTKILTSLLFFYSAISVGGNVVVYTAHGPEIYEPLFKEFRKINGDIKIDVVVLGTGEMFQRVRAEQSNPAADLTFGGPVQSYDINADLYQASTLDADKMAMIKDGDSRWHAFTVFTQPLLVNTHLVKPSEYPTTVASLLDTDWSKKGGLLLANPNHSGTGYSIVAGLANGMGWDFTTQLIKTAKAVPGSTPMFNGVKDGEAAAGWINEDLGAKWEAQGLPVKMIYPTDALTVQVDAYGLVQNAPNAQDAKKLMAFIGSVKGQEIAVKTINRRSVRTDVKPPVGLPKLGELPLFPAKEPQSIVNARFTKILEK